MKRLRDILSYYNDDQIKFRYITALKLSFISLSFVFFVMFSLYILLKIDLIFFNANQFPGAREFQEAYYDFILSNIVETLPYISLSIVLIFFVGMYLTYLILRPFKILSKYCEEIVEGKSSNFNPELFADHRLLVMFSDFFFNATEQMRLAGKYKQVPIPERYTKIHKPVYDWAFFTTYLLIIIALTVATVAGVLVIDADIRERIVVLSTKFLKATPSVKYFLTEQFIVFDLVLYLLVGIHIVVHLFFGFYLYSKVATPAFAIFSTMRAFLKGNKSARIHVIGYTYLRDDCRKINKYLETIGRLPE